MQEVVLIKIREGEKIAYFSTKDLPLRTGIRHFLLSGDKAAQQVDRGQDAHLKKVKIGEYVIIEAERGKDYGMVIAQRFKPPGEKKKFEPVGNAMYLGKTDNLLNPPK